MVPFTHWLVEMFMRMRHPDQDERGKQMNSKMLIIAALTMVALMMAGFSGVSANTDMPSSTVKLVFVHHSTGGNWLADSNEDQPYGDLGTALMNNNYYVSATNYGWGPNSIGDRTDIPDWPDWFTGTNSSTVLSALYAESGQNVGDFGAWARLSTDPGGGNKIIMFKSCFPNSDLFGDPNDPAASSPNDQYTVENAKAVYNDLLTHFATRQDKLFVVITAPPQQESEYATDYQTPAQRAANARAVNNWLVNDWLSGYAYNNVAVFDYFNVLTGENNHHRVVDGQLVHVTTDQYTFAYYPSGDSHPSTTGHQKATTEFVPLLNYYYNQWIAGGDDDGGDDDDDGDSGNDDGQALDGGVTVTSGLWLKAVLKTPAGSFTLLWTLVGTDTTPSGDRVVSGYFYADPTEFAYGSPFNPEAFVKIYIATNGWANIAFNHVTVDDLDLYSALAYSGAYDHFGNASLNNRLVEHTYTGVSLE